MFDTILRNRTGSLRSRTQMFIWSFFMLLVLNGCENYEDEVYTISELDVSACTLLNADSLKTDLRTLALDDSLFSTISEKINVLEDSASLFGFSSDGPWALRLPADTSYALFQPSGTSGSSTAVLFLNEYILIQIRDSGGNEVEFSDTSLPLEIIADCPVIKGRIVFDYDNTQNYLVKFVAEKTFVNVVALSM